MSSGKQQLRYNLMGNKFPLLLSTWPPATNPGAECVVNFHGKVVNFHKQQSFLCSRPSFSSPSFICYTVWSVFIARVKRKRVRMWEWKRRDWVFFQRWHWMMRTWSWSTFAACAGVWTSLNKVCIVFRSQHCVTTYALNIAIIIFTTKSYIKSLVFSSINVVSHLQPVTITKSETNSLKVIADQFGIDHTHHTHIVLTRAA